MDKSELITYHNHTYNHELINTNGWMLDLGCNDFIISRYFIEMGLKVIALDPINNITIPEDLKSNENFFYLQKACVGVKTENKKTYYEYEQWGANSICNTPELLHRPENLGHAQNPLKNSYEVELTTIEELMNEYNIPIFEYLKIDVEGSEYGILENLPNKKIKQFSVEFHDFLKLTPIDDVEFYHENLNKQMSDYQVCFEDKEPLRHLPNAYQRNDILYILKDLI